MGRIRTIKPEFPHSESMGRVSREARLLFILLWTLADDAGRLRGTSRMLASLLYPYDGDAAKHIDAWIADLEREGCIVRYVVGDTSYVQVCNWLKHQRIDHASPSKIPPFDEASRGLQEGSRGTPLGLDLDLEGIGSGSGREGTIEPKPKPQTPRATALGSSNKPPKLIEVAKPAEVPQGMWDEWRALRGPKKLVTERVLTGIEREAGKAGMSVTDALAYTLESSWLSFKAAWYEKAMRSGGTPKRRVADGGDWTGNSEPIQEI